MEKDVEKMDIPQLIERFEKDIVYDCHSLQIKFGRSEAQKELFRREGESLRLIVEHLHQRGFSIIANNKIFRDEIKIAWAMLLNRFEIRVDTKRSAPKDLQDFKGWIRWAERFVA